MTEVMHIQTVEELKRFLDEKGIIEIALRGEKKKFKAFQKIALDELQENEISEKVEHAIQLLNKNVQLNGKNLEVLGNVAKLNKFNIALSGLNLCATCAGFAIMYVKLDKMSVQIADILQNQKTNEANHASFEYKKVLSEHANMLDCRKRQNNYSLEKMRELVDAEHNVLGYLMNVFRDQTSVKRDEILFAILSLAQMLSVSVCYFDEAYYLEKPESLSYSPHTSHSNWVKDFEELTSDGFVELVQDFGLFELGLNTIENDCFYINYYDEILSLKQDIEDNEIMIKTIGEKNLFRIVSDKTNEYVRKEIEKALEGGGVPIEMCEQMINAAAA